MIATNPASKLEPRRLRSSLGLGYPLDAPPPPLRCNAEGLTGETDRDQTAAQVATMLPADLLQPGEIIILLLKPSPWFIVLAPLKALAVLVLATFAAMGLGGYYLLGLSRSEIVLAGLAMIGLRLFWQFLEWLSRVYVLTDQRVIRVKGVIRVNVFETQLKQIQHTHLIFSLRQRLFGLGTLAFATAGTALVEAFWSMVPHPLEVHQKVVQTLNRYRR